MSIVSGHALLLGAAALGAVACLELIAAEGTPRVSAVVVEPVAASNPVKPVILAGDPLNREQLTRALQKELRRVGCYAGEITGAWGASSRHAMRVFTDKLQVRLPIEEPDHVLLKLVQDQKAPVCMAALEPRLIAPPTEAKRPTAKRPASPERRREETTVTEAAPSQRSGAMVPRSGTYSAPPQRSAGTADDSTPPKLVRTLMKSVSGAISALQLP